MRRHRNRGAWVLAGVALGLAACTKTPVTGREVFILTSEAQEAQLGADAYRQILRKSRVSTHRVWTDAMNRVGQRIATAAGRPAYQWEFTLIESTEKNAFCLPGGKVAVYTGIFAVLANEAQLATVLGHEVAHATARHGGQRLTLQFGEEIGFAALSQWLGGTDTLQKQLVLGALGVGAAVGVALPFSRAQESEADYIGEVYMAMAGYDPSAAVALWQAFAKDTSKAPEFLSDHPASAGRSDALKGHLPEAMRYYQTSPRYGLGMVFGGH